MKKPTDCEHRTKMEDKRGDGSRAVVSHPHQQQRTAVAKALKDRAGSSSSGTSLRHRALGGSALTVSSYGLATMTFGGRTPEADALRQLDIARDVGITLFATADDHPVGPLRQVRRGLAQEIVGKWLATRQIRNRVVLTNCVDLRASEGTTPFAERSSCFGPRNIIATVEDGLRRMRTDYVDLLQLRWPERLSGWQPARLGAGDSSALDDTLAVVDDLVTAGKVREIGLSNEMSGGAMRVLAATEHRAMRPIASIQHGYSLIDRSFDHQFAEVAATQRLGLIAAAPLAGGLLTGKYIYGGAPTPGSRLSRAMRFDGGMLFERRRRTVALYAEIASEFGVGLTHMALAFVAARPSTASVLIGASNFGQLESNLGALDLCLSDELTMAIDAIHVARLGNGLEGLDHLAHRGAEG